MKSGIIKFNLNDRKRVHTGKPRNFDIRKVVSLLNSPEMQEKVRNGDITGYYGHWPRLKFGLNPREGGVLDGKVVNLEPSHKTIHLKAFDDGTIEHEVEFMDNDGGRKAKSLMEKKLGGFSSVFNAVGGGYTFHGFDFVHSPNYSGNRPYVLDDAEDDSDYNPYGVLLLDDMEERDKLAFEREYLLDCIDNLTVANNLLTENNTLLTDSLESLNNQNEDLIQETVDLKIKLENKNKEPVFDAVTLDDAVAEANKFKAGEVMSDETPQELVEDSFETEYIKGMFE